MHRKSKDYFLAYNILSLAHLHSIQGHEQIDKPQVQQDLETENFRDSVSIFTTVDTELAGSKDPFGEEWHKGDLFFSKDIFNLKITQNLKDSCVKKTEAVFFKKKKKCPKRHFDFMSKLQQKPTTDPHLVPGCFSASPAPFSCEMSTARLSLHLEKFGYTFLKGAFSHNISDPCIQNDWSRAHAA